MKKHITAILLAAYATISSAQKSPQPATDQPTLYALTQERSLSPSGGGQGGGKTLLIFRTERQAKTWTTLAGFTLIAAGAYLDGKAEMYSRYHGTTSNWDTYHITRDAGHLVTGLGAAGLGLSIGIGGKIKPLELIWKGLAAPILYRITAEATYNATKPR